MGSGTGSDSDPLNPDSLVQPGGGDPSEFDLMDLLLVLIVAAVLVLALGYIMYG